MSKHTCLAKIFDENIQFEIGIDEAGRGPLFGRLYVAAVVLPKEHLFQHEKMRDSKKIKSRKKIQELAQYIKDHSIAWYIHYVDAHVIDTMNIRQAVLMAMHECAKQVISQLEMVESSTVYGQKYMLLVDGNDFTPHMIYDNERQTMKEIQHVTIEGGDNKYSCIAAASILAKNERDTYMENLCTTYPELHEKYGLAKNMGYGTKSHIEGINLHGITQWHRKTYGICKTSRVVSIGNPPSSFTE